MRAKKYFVSSLLTTLSSKLTFTSPLVAQTHFFFYHRSNENKLKKKVVEDVKSNKKWTHFLLQLQLNGHFSTVHTHFLTSIWLKRTERMVKKKKRKRRRKRKKIESDFPSLTVNSSYDFFFLFNFDCSRSFWALSKAHSKMTTFYIYSSSSFAILFFIAHPTISHRPHLPIESSLTEMKNKNFFFIFLSKRHQTLRQIASSHLFVLFSSFCCFSVFFTWSELN